MEYKILSESLIYYVIRLDNGNYVSNSSVASVETGNLLQAQLFCRKSDAETELKAISKQLNTSGTIQKAKMIVIE